MSKNFLQVLIICIYSLVVDGARNILHAQKLEIDCHQLLMTCVTEDGCASFEDTDTDAANRCGQELSESHAIENSTLNRGKHEHVWEFGCGVLQGKELCTITDCLGNETPWQPEQPLLPSINKSYRKNW